MPNPNLIDQEASIVLVGNFNPTIFHPQWFVRHEIVPEIEGEGANVEIIHPEVSKFSFPWVSIEVLQGKFITRTKDADHFIPLRDLVISTFLLLEHSPIKQLGMNLIINYTVDTEEVWHKIGDLLVPKQIWYETLPHRVGMRMLRVQSPRKDNLNGNINVTVESGPHFGVNFNINSHVELNEESSLSEILSGYWEVALQEGFQTAKIIIEKAIES